MDRRSLRAVVVAYLAALAAAAATVWLLPAGDPLMATLWADVVATCVVFGASVVYDNSSLYDPYWSVVPVLIAAWWLCLPDAAGAPFLRQALVTGLVSLWAVRLTWNWARGWSGLDHEDWRYADMRSQTGALYWVVSFAGIHMLPTLLVFAGCLALWPALVVGTQPLSVLDGVAAVVTGGAIWLEARADKQLLVFRRGNPPAEAILDTGVWAYCRHPNYLGEIGFWWGLYLFSLAAAPALWWTGAGAVAITLLFRFISLRLIDTRMLARRPAYAERMRTVPALLPRLRRY
jgi:steroid 5-alpha reductase family enzyme